MPPSDQDFSIGRIIANQGTDPRVVCVDAGFRQEFEEIQFRGVVRWQGQKTEDQLRTYAIMEQKSQIRISIPLSKLTEIGARRVSMEKDIWIGPFQASIHINLANPAEARERPATARSQRLLTIQKLPVVDDSHTWATVDSKGLRTTFIADPTLSQDSPGIVRFIVELGHRAIWTLFTAKAPNLNNVETIYELEMELESS